MNRRDFLKTGAATTTLLLALPAWAAAEEKDQVSDEEIVAQTKERIEKHRKGEGTIRVVDAKGKPVRGVKVTVEQLRHRFLFGSNFFMFNRCGSPDLEAAYRQRFTAVLNYCTLGFYWASYEAERGKPQYGYSDEVAAWTAEHGITCKGHPLVWDHRAGSPDWLPDDAVEIERLSLARVRDLVSRFKGRLEFWDIVNEPTHLTDRVNRTKMADWARAKGAVPYVAEHLQAARAANPHATLLVNDYRNDPPYYRILDGLRERGKLLMDVIGLQSHMHNGVWPLHKVWEICDTYGRLGLPLHFTETTILSGPRTGPGENWGPTNAEDESSQAERTASFYTALFAHPAVQAITWWDFSDLGAWQAAAAGWLRKDMSPKPVYERLASLIKGAWWTKAQGVTEARGRFKLRAFYGQHRATAELPNGERLTQEVDWVPGGKREFVITPGA